MTGTTLNSTVLDRNPVVNAVANTKKVTGKTQDFGDVLDKTAQKLEQPDKTDNTKTSVKQPDNKTAAEPKDAEPAREDTAVEEHAESKAPQEETVETKDAVQTETAATDSSEAEEAVDEMTVDEIARALEQIIEQIKQILGVTDEQLLSGMEDLNMKPFDLLNSDNMAQLVTTISGEDSVISLVADEQLYAALQDVTEMVETTVNDLLENTGLTSEELDVVLQKLQELESRTLDEQMGDAEMLPSDGQEEQGTQQADAEQHQETPVIIEKDHSQPAKTYDTLPENQQENLVETLDDSRARNAGRDAKDNDNKESKHFGQSNTSQNFQNNVNETSGAVTEGVEKFTSESTENIMRQLADMVKIVKGENLTEMELQLHPASLGTVNVSLTTKGGVVTAQFTTQNEAVKAAIEAQATQLQVNLEEQGVKIEAIEVSVASHEMERNLDKEGSGQQQSEEQKAERVQGTRRRSINLRALGEDGELEQELSGADDATRIAMEMMAANGNSMDLLA